MTKPICLHLVKAWLAFWMTSLFAHYLLWNRYHTMRPSHAQAELGRIYESNNRGVAVYLTADEETALSLLVVGLTTGFLLLAVVLVISPQIRGGSLLDYTRQDWLATGGYVLFYIGMMILAGPAIGSLSVSRKLTFLICRLVGY